jgi:hypothetical protein
MGMPLSLQEAISISEIFDYWRVLYNKPREIPHWLGPVHPMWHHKIAQEPGLFVKYIASSTSIPCAMQK